MTMEFWQVFVRLSNSSQTVASKKHCRCSSFSSWGTQFGSLGTVPSAIKSLTIVLSIPLELLQPDVLAVADRLWPTGAGTPQRVQMVDLTEVDLRRHLLCKPEQIQSCAVRSERVPSPNVLFMSRVDLAGFSLIWML